jgi:hypothetical protein
MALFAQVDAASVPPPPPPPAPAATPRPAASATFRGHPLPKSKQRTRRWTDPIPGSPWADAAPDAHWTRFHRDVGEKEEGDPAATREALRFSRAFAIELRDVLSAACAGRRCAAPAAEAARTLAAYLRDPSPAYANGARHAPDNWNYVWSWTATGGGVTLRVSCDDMLESPELLCDLGIDLPGDLTLVYATFHRDVTLYAATDRTSAHPLGRICDAAEGAPGPPTIFIDGKLLNVRR